MTVIPTITGPDAFAAAFSVSRETLSRLTRYAELLATWQKTINLVAPATLDEAWHRHFADSAQLMALVPPDAKTLADLGSGGGFPGLVLAIMLADRGVAVTLIESDQRKGAFLREVARQVAIPVDILSMRIESAETRTRVDAVDVVTARALAPLDRLLGWVAPLFAPHSVALLLKGRDAEIEIADARKRWRFDVELRPSLTAPDARIAVVRHLDANREG